MQVPERDVVNGIITEYECLYSTSEDASKIEKFSRLKDEVVTTVVISGLRKFFNHTIMVRAHTRIGPGKVSEPTIVKTLEDGKIFS